MYMKLLLSLLIQNMNDLTTLSRFKALAYQAIID